MDAVYGPGGAVVKAPETLAGQTLAKLETQERSLRARLVAQEGEEAALVTENAGAREAMVEKLALEPEADPGKLRADIEAKAARLEAVRAVLSATREALVRVQAVLEEKLQARAIERRREILTKAEAEAKTAASEAVSLFEKLVPILSKGSRADTKVQTLAQSLGPNCPNRVLFRFSSQGIADNVADLVREKGDGVTFERVDFPVHAFNAHALAGEIELEVSKN